MTERKANLIRHAIGLDGRSSVTNRNHYCIGEGGESHADWNELVEAGLATVRRNVKDFGGMDIFYATREAAAEVLRKGESIAEDFRP